MFSQPQMLATTAALSLVTLQTLQTFLYPGLLLVAVSPKPFVMFTHVALQQVNTNSLRSWCRCTEMCTSARSGAWFAAIHPYVRPIASCMQNRLQKSQSMTTATYYGHSASSPFLFCFISTISLPHTHVLQKPLTNSTFSCHTPLHATVAALLSAIFTEFCHLRCWCGCKFFNCAQAWVHVLLDVCKVALSYETVYLAFAA